MKRIIRIFLIELLSLYLVRQMVTGLVFQKGIETFIITAFVLGITTLLAKPVINLLLLPLNLITFGLFKWASSAIALYLVTLIVKDFKIVEFVFQGIHTEWVDIPSMNFKGITAFIAYSFILSLITSFIRWARK